MTQQTRLLDLLRKGPVTAMTSWNYAGIYRPAYLVHRMRKRGYKIDTQMTDYTTTRGQKVKFAKYVLRKEPRRG